VTDPGMQVLWAPWRMTYVGAPKAPGCIFCAALTTADARASLVLTQQPAIVMLNRFPYISGHLMVAPRRHVADLGALPADEFQTLMDVMQRTATRLRDALHAEGMNIGINLGAAAGAGVTDHLHWHLVPRWNGDTNFMPLLAEVRVIPEHLEATYDTLRPLFATHA
jgi:ATP adenylyltransferase